MRQVVRGRFALGLLALAACPTPPPTQAPPPGAEVRAQAGERSDTAASLLPRHGLHTADAMCREAGYDFAYDPSGIEHEDGDVTIACGRGPGTACDERRASFCDGGSMIACKRGKLTATDCAQRCRTVGDPEGTPRAGGGCETHGDEGLCVCW